MTPQQAAAARSAAIEEMQAKLAGAVTQAQRLLYEDLLERLQDTLDDPTIIAEILTAYRVSVAVPLATYYAQSILTLPGLTESYFAALDVAGYQALRALLASFLEARFGVTATGAAVPGGYLSTVIGDTTAQRELLAYAYEAQASGVGLTAYRKGMEQLVTGADVHTQGLMGRLYKEAGDMFNQADRTLQKMSADTLGLSAYLYQGGLIDTSRPFCKARNGKAFTNAEVKTWGTSKDKLGGYTKKAEGMFSGKTDPYDPFVDCGGYSCRHGLHAIPNVVVLRLRPDLREDEMGRLVVA
jgi:hypothetical protein